MPSVAVRLDDVGTRPIAVIAVVRDVTGLGLADAKALVDGAPAIVARVGSDGQALDLVDRLRDAGAHASIEDDAGDPDAGSSVDVRLDAVGPNKIAVIKVVREATRLGLAETKGLVEQAPVVVARMPSDAAALDLVERLQDAGARASTTAAARPSPRAVPQGVRTVRLIDPGRTLIAVIKAIRTHSGLGLAESKACIDRLPSEVGPLAEERALALYMELVQLGATVEIQ